jgi:hypothetical protein
MVTRTAYDENTAWGHRAELEQSQAA